ncbi:MAG: AAA family ATPase [Caldilineaceae bacterium]|nr:AAA family ATPase [Caldilineaceae bacterium]HRJ43862.1 AAA family ATPase [Caldilineaceae bacterium]
MSILDIHLLGDFRIAVGDKPITTINQARQQAILAYLLLHRHAPQSRQHLAFLFWPDSPEAQARTNLRNLLYKLRQVLPNADQFVQSDTQTVCWQADVRYRFDVADFEAALSQASTRAALEKATALYAGDLLPSCYDDWILPERERLRLLALDGLTRLVELLESERDYRTAIGYGERLLGLDPLSETAYRTLMRLHAADSDRAGALRVFQRCVETLRVELDVEPSPATSELHQRLLAADFPPPTPSPANPDQLPLVGRAAEWGKLRDIWFSASSGKPQCVVLVGEAGIGKTRLAEELIGWVESQGFAAPTAHCYAAEGTLTYAPVVSWLRSPLIHKRLASLEPVWLGQVARLLPELLVLQPDLPKPGASSDGWQRQNLFEATARALLSAADPLLLFVDDLQWADRDTLEWLHYLLRFHSRARLLLLATVRAEDAATNPALQAFVSALGRDGQISELEIGPLNASESGAVVEAVAGVPLRPDEVGQLFRETEGNPLFVVETARASEWLGMEQSRQRGATICGRDSHDYRRDRHWPYVIGLASRAGNGQRATALCGLPSGRRDDLVHTG